MSMKSTVQSILDSQFLNDFRPSPQQIELIDQLVAHCKNKNPCEVVLSHSPENYNTDKLAAIMSMLMWQSHDNGKQVIETLESWAIGKDLRKARIAHSDLIEVKLKNVNHPT